MWDQEVVNSIWRRASVDRGSVFPNLLFFLVYAYLVKQENFENRPRPKFFSARARLPRWPCRMWSDLCTLQYTALPYACHWYIQSSSVRAHPQPRRRHDNSVWAWIKRRKRIGDWQRLKVKWFWRKGLEEAFFWDGVILEPSGTQSPRRQESNPLAGYTIGRPVVYPANAFDSRLRGDWVLLGSSPTQSKKKTFRVSGPQSPFSVSSSCILFFVLLLFFLKKKKKKKIRKGTIPRDNKGLTDGSRTTVLWFPGQWSKHCN